MTETQLERELEAAVGRVTPQRRLITSILQEQGHHLSAEEILLLGRREQARLSLATVYRTLRRLKDSGLVRELRLTGDRLAEQHEFKITSARVRLIGYCVDCRARVQNKT